MKAEGYAGLDLGVHGHVVVGTNAEGHELLMRTLRQDGEALGRVVDELVGHADGRAEQVVVGLESPRGSVVRTLQACGVRVFALNPRQTRRFSERYSMSECKDDVSDARVMAWTVRTDPQAYDEVPPCDEATEELRVLESMRTDSRKEALRAYSRAHAVLMDYYPAVLRLGSPWEKRWLRELWRLAPTPAAAHDLDLSQVEALLRRFRVRRYSPSEVLQVLQRLAPTTPERLAAATARRVRLLLEQVDAHQGEATTLEREIRQRLDALSEAQSTEESASDIELLSSAPGVGDRALVSLITLAGAAIERRDGDRIRQLGGSCAVTVQTGTRVDRKTGRMHRKRGVVQRRRACNHELADRLFHMGQAAAVHDPIEKLRYARLRARGHSHGRACRQIADRMIPVLMAMLRTGRPYDVRERRRAAEPLGWTPEGEQPQPQS